MIGSLIKFYGRGIDVLKRVKLKIHSLIDNLDDAGLSDGDPEINDVSPVGTMKIFGDEISISYKESVEGAEISTDILKTENGVTVTRRGALSSTLHFAPNEVYKTIYSVPPYKFDMTVTTVRINSTLSESGGELDLIYRMEVGGACKKCRMRILVSEVSK